MGKYRSQKFTEEKNVRRPDSNLGPAELWETIATEVGGSAVHIAIKVVQKTRRTFDVPDKLILTVGLNIHEYSYIAVYNLIIYIYHIYIQLIYIALHSQQFTYIDLPHFAQILDNVVGFCRSAFFRCFPGECHGVASNIGTYNVLKY